MLESKQCLAYTLFLKVLLQRRVDAHLLISIVVLGFLLTSCAAIRGYFKDGKDGRVLSTRRGEVLAEPSGRAERSTTLDMTEGGYA